jgi:nucleoside-diphosphate-sugar epimerase
MQKHVLVAGGAGYIGSVLVPLLAERGHRVTVVDRLFFGPTLVAHPNVEVVREDTRSVPARLFRGVDAVIDLAGISNDPSCEIEPSLTTSVNVDGAKRLLRLATEAGVPRYVYSSSCSVYGHGEREGLTESSARNPVSLYAKSKIDVEDALFASGIAEPVVLRLATVFGVSRRMRFDLAVNVMTKNAYVNQRITVDGGGRQWRPFVHVRDAALAFSTAVEAARAIVGGQVFNVGSKAGNTRILNLAFRVRDAIPGTEVVHAPTDPDRRDYNVAFDKIESALGFHARVTLDDGIREVLGALREGTVDPDDRRAYTLRQYMFLREAEAAVHDLALGGRLLAPPAREYGSPKA